MGTRHQKSEETGQAIMRIRIDINWEVDFPESLFVKPLQVRLDLSKSKFEEWKDWYIKELVKCDTWTSVIQNFGDDELSLKSDFDMYRDISDKLLEAYPDNYFYPMFDPLYARHIPSSGWIEMNDDKEVPVSDDLAKDWPKHFPKRSCVSCTGASGQDADDVWRSWCPIINDFMEKKGKKVDRSLEKMGESLNFDAKVPKEIREYLDKAVESEDDHEGRNGQSNLN